MPEIESICFIASIIPGKHDAFEGDFILRHAIALSTIFKVNVYFSMETDLVTMVELEEENFNENLIIYRNYLPVSYKSIFKKYKYYKRSTDLILKHHQKKSFKIIHANILWRAGYLANQISNQIKLPYVISEHLGYFNQAYYREESVGHYSPIKKFLAKKAMQEASMIMPVSDILGKWIKDFSPKSKCTTVSNVVDTELFYFDKKSKHYNKNYQDSIFKFTHASMLYTEKNVFVILDAILLLAQKNTSFEFHFYTPIMKYISDFTDKHKLQAVIFQNGMIPHDKMPAIFQQSDCNVLYSTSETQGVVILESLCCGKPNIVSNIPAFDTIIDDKNGLVGNFESAMDLSECMENMILNYEQYDQEKIALDAASKYSMAQIAALFSAVYDNVLKKQ
jgi:glycosyltransferase involved in cell wall biosynthesis